MFKYLKFSEEVLIIMKLIAKITDEDIGEKIYEINNPVTRKAVHAILINDSGEIAILHKSKKMSTN
jgi:hypothetical protein